MDEVQDLAAERLAEIGRLQREIDALHRTLSWRVTKPLRSVRRRTSRPVALPTTSTTNQDGTEPSAEIDVERFERAMARRLLQVAELIHGPTAEALSDTGIDAFEVIRGSIEATDLPPLTIAWLVLVACGAAYPNEGELAMAGQALRVDGTSTLLEHGKRFFADCRRFGRTTDLDLEIVTDAVVIDISHTAGHNLHTGIQRVVRETVTRWINGQPDLVVAHWEFVANSPRRLSAEEIDRFAEWRTSVTKADAVGVWRDLAEATGRVIVPWKATVMIPELAAEPDRCDAYRAMKAAGICTLALLVYDLIPYTASETTPEGMPVRFSNAVSLAKIADKLSAISHATAAEFRAFNLMVEQQGLRGPRVEAHPLPASAEVVTADDLAETRRSLGLSGAPIVLVVGSHEPRKNHFAVLEAAETLWREQHRFQLVFVGGAGWKSESFDHYAARLMNDHDLQIIKKASEVQLWSLYKLARFTVFPSLVEGFGLPIAESLASGTPVITSNYGSMKEAASDGGSILIDPRDIVDLTRAMRELVVDDARCDQLRNEAAALHFRSWDSYATELWSYIASDPAAR